MVQEEQNQRCSISNIGGGGCGRGGRGSNSKKLKQKKIPQRGLGVEKLEKIRLEEQRKNGTAATRPVVLLPLHQPSSSTTTTSSLYRASSSISVPHHHPDLFAPPPPLLTTNSSTLYGHNNNDFVNPTCGGSGSNNGSVMGWSVGAGAIGDGGYGCPTSTWNSSSYDLEVPRMDSEFRIGMNSQSDLRLNLPFSVPIPREPPQHHQHHQYQYQQLSSMVNVPSSTSSSSGLSLQMEPPSNQSFYSNYGPPPWPEKEKMVGMKRPWPFSLDNPPGSSSKFHPIIPNLGHRPDESSSSSFGNMNIGTLSFDLGNAAIFREAYSRSNGPNNTTRTGGCTLELKQNKNNEENVGLDGDSLTLGLSTTTTSSSSTTLKSKQPLLFPSSQGGVEDPLIDPESSIPEWPVYSFFPPKKQQIVHVHGMSERRGEAGGIDVDLTLKL